MKALDCSSAGLAGEFRLDCVNWTGVPSHFTPLEVLLLSDNAVTLLPRGAINCRQAEGLESLKKVDLTGNPGVEWVANDLTSPPTATQGCDEGMEVTHDLVACPLGAALDVTAVESIVKSGVRS